MAATKTASPSPVPVPVSRFSEATRKLIARTRLPKGATADDLDLLIYVAEARGLDPLLGQLYLSIRLDKNGQKHATVETNLDGFRIMAGRSQLYAGQTEVEYCGPDGKWTTAWTKEEPPTLVRVGVFRKGFDRPQYGQARYSSYVQHTAQGIQRNWRAMPDVMLAACAEKLAFRKTFPELFSGVYGPDEMANVEGEDEAIKLDLSKEPEVSLGKPTLEVVPNPQVTGPHFAPTASAATAPPAGPSASPAPNPPAPPSAPTPEPAAAAPVKTQAPAKPEAPAAPAQTKNTPTGPMPESLKDELIRVAAQLGSTPQTLLAAMKKTLEITTSSYETLTEADAVRLLNKMIHLVETQTKELQVEAETAAEAPAVHKRAIETPQAAISRYLTPIRERLAALKLVTEVGTAFRDHYGHTTGRATAEEAEQFHGLFYQAFRPNDQPIESADEAKAALQKLKTLLAPKTIAK